MDDATALRSAAALIDAGQDAAALRHIGQVLGHDPANPLARLYEVMALEGVDAEKARTRAEALVAGHPEWAEAWVQLTFILAHHATASEAAAAASRTLQLDPDNVQVHLSMSDALFNAHEYQPSLDAVERALALGVRLWQAQVRKGYCLFMLGHQAEGLEIVRRVVGEHPDEPEAVKALAALEADSGNHQRALELANRAAAEAMGQKGTAEMVRRILISSLNRVVLTWLGCGLVLSIIWARTWQLGAAAGAGLGVAVAGLLPGVLIGGQVLAWPRLSRGQTRRKVVGTVCHDAGMAVLMGTGVVLYAQPLVTTILRRLGHRVDTPTAIAAGVVVVALAISLAFSWLTGRSGNRRS
jgi:tetratricopeptide (TPR) repeat protein